MWILPRKGALWFCSHQRIPSARTASGTWQVSQKPLERCYHGPHPRTLWASPPPPRPITSSRGRLRALLKEPPASQRRERPYPMLPVQTAVLPNTLPEAVPPADQDLLGLPLTRVSRQIVSVVGQGLKWRHQWHFTKTLTTARKLQHFTTFLWLCSLKRYLMMTVQGGVGAERREVNILSNCVDIQRLLIFTNFERIHILPNLKFGNKFW